MALANLLSELLAPEAPLSPEAFYYTALGTLLSPQAVVLSLE